MCKLVIFHAFLPESQTDTHTYTYKRVRAENCARY